MKTRIGILAFVCVSACRDSTAPNSSLTIPDNGGSAQTGVIGERVATAPTVLVTDGGNPVAGVEVSFAVTSGGGSVSSATQMTDASGLASVGWTLGRTFGKNELNATVAGLPPVTFTAMAIAPDTGIVAFDLIDPLGDTVAQSDKTLAPAIDLLSLRGEFRSSDLILTATFSAPVSSNFGAPGFVRGVILFDTDDNPITREYELDLAGTQTVIRGGSTSTSVETSFGENTLAITIPLSTLGNNDGNFSFTGAFGPADRESDRFPNNGVSAVRLGLDMQAVAGLSQTGVMGELFSPLPTVHVTDLAHHSVSGVEVSFVVTSGGGSVDSTTRITDSGGLASVGWTLGRRFGIQTLTATAPGAEPVTFNPTVIAPDSGILAFSLADPAGDTLAETNTTLPQAIDLLSLRGDFKRDSLILTATFSAPVSSQYDAPNFLTALIEFDIDDDSSTGGPFTSAGFAKVDDAGVDFRLLSGTGAGISPGPANPVPVTFSGSTVVWHIPMSRLGNDDGEFRLMGVIGGVNSRVTDVFPNSGPIVVRLGSAPVSINSR